MGCGSSASNGTKGDKKGGGEKKGGQKRLLDSYTVGEMLGQGAFGIVYACKPHGQDRECAVKMVDKVETPVDKIREEAEMLKKLDHTNVIKCLDVIFEKCFVCIVMDRMRGGDLIVGMQAHWKSKGKIPVLSTVHISYQMASSVAYLHNQSIVHRDVKGDNYLSDRNDIVDPQCRVVLTDFGTAIACKATERLHEKCGTKLYWSPEFFKHDYSLKVDVWAIGVVVYGLLNGRFPFRDEKDIWTKSVNIPKNTPPDCETFVLSMLEKAEDKRASSQQVAAHPWVASKAANQNIDKNAAVGGDEAVDADAFAEGGANQGIQERRHELIERLQDNQKKRNSQRSGNRKSGQGAPEEHYWKEWFSIVDRHAQNSTLRYEWWPHTKVDEANILSLQGAKAVNDLGKQDKASTTVIGQQLREHGIDTTAFGKGESKTLEQLAAEVQGGAAVLMLDASSHKRLVRVVDVVCLRIAAAGSKNKFLIETGEKFADGRNRNILRLPGTKKEPHENSKQTAERVLNDMINLQGAKVSFDFDLKETFEEEEESPSYPGVTTVYRKEIIQGQVKDEGGIKGKGDWTHKDKTGNTKFFQWMTDKQCTQKKIKYKAPEEGEEVSGLVQAPIGMAEDELRSYLEANKVDVSKFGQNKTKTLKDISSELIKGESSLMQDAEGNLMRVVDVVVIKLVHSVTQSILVQTEQSYPDGTKVPLKRLPGAKRRPDENQFLTARRILKRQLKVEENHVTLNAGDVQVVEEEKESLAYPGLRTVYRKRIITAMLSKSS
mmetsp:Transcript_123867/g.231814  ORF Transcript_123867/g.231814 Transcript_123867/m.231814 type:complete len:774 (+) Transcript_123867:158-2479(+)